MAVKKIKAEIFDGDGNRYTISLEGKVSRRAALRLLDLIELLGGMPDEAEPQSCLTGSSKFDKTMFVVEKHFPFAWFTSKEILETYEQDFKEKISLSTISTYLGRMADRGFLTKGGHSNNKKYKAVTGVAQNVLTNDENG
ncbi:MAG: hypothetical protein JSV64_03260 [Candidatus Bathyarchaeota archaeon]|jgi:hypothetical protein|nr:MAG: hypothetical protein JSV64_03260 [Candidatus Bathyarchaeota archaeon]